MRSRVSANEWKLKKGKPKQKRIRMGCFNIVIPIHFAIDFPLMRSDFDSAPAPRYRYTAKVSFDFLCPIPATAICSDRLHYSLITAFRFARCCHRSINDNPCYVKRRKKKSLKYLYDCT